MPPARRLPLLLSALAAACGGDAAPSVAYEGPYAREVRRAIPAIERSTGLRFTAPPRLEVRTRDEVRQFLEAQFARELPPLTLAGIERSYKRFGLLPDSLALRGFLLNLLTEQVAGYYDPVVKVLYVVRDAPTEYLGVTVAHELVHALQDQYLSLDSLTRRDASNDRQVAAQALIEGQAVFEQLVAQTGSQDPSALVPGGWEGVRNLIRDAQSAMPLFAAAPVLIQETLLFPYLAGAEYVRRFKARRPGVSPLTDVPRSTEQILHAEAFFGAEPDEPTGIVLPPLAPGVTAVHEDDLGEFETRLLLFEHLKDAGRAAAAARGWDGDRYVLAQTPAGEALAWVTVWDGPVDAAEFVEALDAATARRFRPATRGDSTATRRRFAAQGRRLGIEVVQVAGRPVVVYTDLPAGAADLFDARRIRLEP